MTQTTAPAWTDEPELTDDELRALAAEPPPYGPSENPPMTALAIERYRTRVRRVDSRDSLALLETFVGRMERRYEYSSEEMTERVRSGQQKCTREISLWLPRYRRLLRLREALAAEAGTATRTTAVSTRAS